MGAPKNPRPRHFIAEYAADGNAATFREALAVSQWETANGLELNRQRALHGLLEAVETAKAQRNPAAQIAGWREIAKMLGSYAPRYQVRGVLG